MSPIKHVQEAVRICEVHLAANYGSKLRLPMIAKSICMMGYDPELDTSPELDPDVSSYLLSVIGILR